MLTLQTPVKKVFLRSLIVISMMQLSYAFLSSNPMQVTKHSSTITSTRNPLNVLCNPNDETNPFDGREPNRDPRHIEFHILPEDNEITSHARWKRMEQEKTNQEMFASHGNDLWKVHKDLDGLSKKLVKAMASGEDTRILRKQIRELEQKDPNIVYGIELDRMDKAMEEKRTKDAYEHRQKALNARSHLAQFNFEGLWIGKYGDHGFEMVNVTYIGDTLIARKVTGDKNVPAGEITFQVDLNPQRHSNSLHDTGNQKLPNIVLSEEASKRWGNKELQRFAGLGHVASEGFVNSQWLEGQLVVINEEYFSFAWLPIGCQIFFGRPSPELSLSMLKESMNKPAEQDDLEVSMEHVTKCFDATVDALEDGSLDDASESCIIIQDGVCCFE